MPLTRRNSKARKPAQRRLVFHDVEHIDEDESSGEVGVTQTIELPQSPRRRIKREIVVTTLESPPASKLKVSPITPEEAEIEELSKYVPKYIHKNVQYSRKGEAKLAASEGVIFKWIWDHYFVPKDFEQNRLYGPLSGTSYETRVIQAYSNGKLERNPSAPGAEAFICTACSEIGHKRDDCPTLI
jgi:hypothetical protein